jgi:hypothetical protein
MATTGTTEMQETEACWALTASKKKKGAGKHVKSEKAWQNKPLTKQQQQTKEKGETGGQLWPRQAGASSHHRQGHHHHL